MSATSSTLTRAIPIASLSATDATKILAGAYVFADVSGDVWDDVIVFGLNGVSKSVRSGSTFGAFQFLTPAFASVSGWDIFAYPVLVGDVDGNGTEDLVGLGEDGLYVWK